jgi:hypothetical protein
MKLTRNVLVAAAAVGVAAAGGSALTAANTGTPLTSAGQGEADATGFAVSDFKYVLATNTASTGDEVASVTFTLTASNSVPATNVRLQLVKANAYYGCTVGTATGGATPVTCTTTGQKVLAIDTVDIVAVSHHAA